MGRRPSRLRQKSLPDRVPSGGSHQSMAVAPDGGSISSGPDAAPATPSVSKPIAFVGATSPGSNRRDGEKPTDHQMTASISPIPAFQGSPRPSLASDKPGDRNHRIAASVSPIHAAQGPIDPSTDSMKPLHTHSDSAIRVMIGSESSLTNGVESSAGRSRASIAPKAFAVDLFRASNEVTSFPESKHSVDIQRSGVGVSSPGMTVGHQTSSPAHAEPSTNFVRNPLSADLRNSSIASSAPTEGGTSPAGQGGLGRNSGEDLFGATSASHDGASLDLSKTNELLQQLVDAVRMQSGSCLPNGGPSVYPDR